MQLAPSRWDARLERLPSHLRERENCSRLRSNGSTRSYQFVSPPLPLTQFRMQGSDLIFFFPPLSEGVGFHFLCWPSLCLRWAQPKAHLSGEGTAGRRGQPAPSSGFSRERPGGGPGAHAWGPGAGAGDTPATSGRAGIQSAASAVLRFPLSPGWHTLEHRPS